VIYGRLDALAAAKVVSVPSGQGGGYKFTDLDIEPLTKRPKPPREIAPPPVASPPRLVISGHRR